MSNTDADESPDSVSLVREPMQRSLHPLHPSRAHPTSTNGGLKRPDRGVPIDVPTTHRRRSTFSVTNANPALMTGSRDGGGILKRKTSISQQGQAHRSSISSPPSTIFFNGIGDYDVVGTIARYNTPLLEKERDTQKHPKSKAKSTEIVLVSDEDELHDPKSVKRKRLSKDPVITGSISDSSQSGGTMISRMKKSTTPIDSSYKSDSTLHPTLHPDLTRKMASSLNNHHPKPVTIPRATTAKSENGSAGTTMNLSKVVSVTVPVKSPPRQQPVSRLTNLGSLSRRLSLTEKVSSLGSGTSPLAHIACLRIGTNEIKKPDMTLQLGSDQFNLVVDNIQFKLPYDDIRIFEYYTEEDIKLLVIGGREGLEPGSILDTYYDPRPDSGKSRRILVYCDAKSSDILICASKLREMGVDAKQMLPDLALKIINQQRLSKAPPSPSPPPLPPSSLPLPPPVTPPHVPEKAEQGEDQLLFVYPFKSNVKSKSIAIRSTDVSRLADDEFLNDTLIEFGLNKGVASTYEAIKSWTNKVDLFSKKYIIVPIHENLHWYLAIITNPGLLLREPDQSTTSSPSIGSSSEAESKLRPMNGSAAAATGDTEPATEEPENSVSATATEFKDAVADSAFQSLLHREKPAAKSSKLSQTPLIDPESKPYIIVLDSLEGSHPNVFKSLRSYLQQELLHRKNVDLSITSKVIPGRYAKCPQQKNFCDCGLYLLHYAESFLQHPSQLLTVILNKSEDPTYWGLDELKEKRERYREIVSELTEEYKAYRFSLAQIAEFKGKEKPRV
ncbi:hypothetical protein BGW38_003448 [Lunasporangiospora selenospora]|uniref:Ubiquitin-like protease family profile domain-containing protein n=1 Tax=Lunasporangiospora selenospora TaxID=979761 RepID=A0A9P6KHL2_9FUNG|nr:hypothetical protein BGW38_003448 [Lunasporangiospora selenospora]